MIKTEEIKRFEENPEKFGKIRKNDYHITFEK